MNRPFSRLLALWLPGLAILSASCNLNNTSEEGITTDSASIARGRHIFNQTCVACHSMDRDGIGPALGGITREVPTEWLQQFIRDPKSVIEAGDARAKALFERYRSVMPSFAYYSEEDIAGIIAFMHTQKAAEKRTVLARDEKLVVDPFPGGIIMSDLVVDMQHVATMPRTSEQKPFTRITKFFPRPDTNEFFVLDLRGKLYRLTNGKADVYLDMAQHMPDFMNAPGHGTGFGSFAFHPDFARNGLLYTTHTEPPGSAEADFFYDDTLNVKLQWVISEWKTNQPSSFPFEGDSRELFRVNMVGQSHGVQEITFNDRSKPGDEDYGLLYIGIGDGGSAERGIIHINIGPENIWSSILRIDPAGRNSKNGKYGIPPTNPFANSKNSKALGEVYAYGFRNPHKITWTKGGKMLASNIGQHQVEELNLILPGHNYGWPFREGSFSIYLKESARNIYALTPDDEANHYNYPVAEYDHDEGNAIIGGYEYEGSTIPELKGKYVFGDMVNGRLFYVNVDDITAGVQAPMQEFQVSLRGQRISFKELCNDERLSMRFGRDHEGELYVSTMPDGRVYKLVKAFSSNMKPN